MKLLLDKHLEMEINVLFQLPLTADWIRIRYLQDHEEDRQQEVGHHAQLSARGEDSLQPESLMISISSLQFHELDDTIYNLFWTLLDPGAIGKFGCTCITQWVSRYLSMFLFGLYLLLTYIIILNLLIALMSTKITNITEKGVSLKDHSVLMMTI